MERGRRIQTDSTAVLSCPLNRGKARQVVIPEAIRERLGLEAGVQFVVVGEGDVVVLKVLKAPKMADFKALLDKAQQSAEAAALTPEDIERAIREVQANA